MEKSSNVSVSYHVFNEINHYWVNDFVKAKAIYDDIISTSTFARLYFEEWEGEAGGEGVHYEYCLFQHGDNINEKAAS